jgi:putative metallohydrolase (TIGR04338 family)
MPRRQRLGTSQARLYAAESATIAKLGQVWTRLQDAQRHLDAVLETEWFTARWPDLLRCTIERRGSGSVWSTCERLDTAAAGDRPTEGVILVADGALCQPVVLHELAHLVVASDAGHGPVFAQALLSLVRHDMGFFAYAELLQALRQARFAGLVDDSTQPPSILSGGG